MTRAAATRARPTASWRPLGLLALVVYGPLLLTARGWVSADTKTYLYLDPGRLLSRAWSMWDPSVGMGTVSHQSIGYLWPMGPWFWVFDRLGVPDWVAQRLWWGTLLLAAGAGVAYLLRLFRWPPAAVWPAVFAYALSPYVLSLLGRLSGVLLPFAGLPWLLALTIQSVRHRGWRHPALFALVVATCGSVNLTALALVGTVPLLWLAYAGLVERAHPRSQIAGAAARIGLLTVAVNAWWLAGLSVQATHGIDIIRYTETAEVVARTSSAQEVLRGLGYWFFYGGDKLELWTEHGFAYTQRPWLLVASFAVPVLAMVGAGIGRWRHRSFFVALVAMGTVLSVGAHPWGEGPPFGRLVQAFLGSDRGLAFRSLPRAVPVVALGLAVLLGAGVGALVRRRPHLARPLTLGTCLLAVVVLAPLWQRTMVAGNLGRQEVPGYWLEAAGAIDAGDHGTRVLELPGSDFAFYRWGMTVDPITPGLVDRPYVARELVPHGSAPAADLLNALDLGLQERTADPASLAPLARLMRAGDLVVRSDLQYERYNIARPRLVWDLVGRAPGLGAPDGFGPADPNEPVASLQLRDEAWLLQEAGLDDPPAVAIIPVEGVDGIVSLRPSGRAVLLSGDGAGVVDAAAAGLIDGRDLVRYSASLDPGEVAVDIDRGALLLVTDTNRVAGERWSGVRQTRGYTEPADLDPVAEDLTDNRLPRFPEAGPEARTVAEHRGGLTASASSYGNPIGLIGEERPVAAVDGDPTTAWRTANFTDARGERLRLRLDGPRAVDRVRLLQPTGDRVDRFITEVAVSLDGGPATRVALDQRSREAPGQLVELPEAVARTVTVELVADTAGDRPRYGGVGPVGFAEVRVNDDPDLVVDEVVRLPSDLLAAGGDATHDRPLAYLLTRLRQDPTDTTRDDEERALARAFTVPTDRAFSLLGTARLSARADDATLDALLGQVSPAVAVTGTPRVDGSRVERASAALDGDRATAWTSRWGEPVGAALSVTLAEAATIDHLDLAVVADGRHSVPTELAVQVDGGPVATVELPEVPVDGSDAPGTVHDVRVPIPAATGREVTVTVTAVRPVTSTDWDSQAQVAHPVAIAELGVGQGSLLPGPPARFDTGCRQDLLTIGGEPVPVRISGPTGDALAGRPLAVRACEPVELAAGDHDLRAAPGRLTGLDLDQLVLRSAAGGAPHAGSGGPLRGPGRPADAGTVEVLDEGRDRARVRVAPRAGDPTWLVLGQSHNPGWTASLDGTDLGPPALVDGFANGWLLPAGAEDGVVELRFAPQRRVDLALRLSLVAALGCVVLAFRRPRLALLLGDRVPAGRAGSTPGDRGQATAVQAVGQAAAPEPYAPVTAFRYHGRLPSRRAAVLAAVGVAAGASLLAPPLVALALGAATAVGCRRETSRRWLTLLPAVLLAAAGAYTVAWQVRYGILPGIEWPEEVHRAHPVALAAVLALVADAVVARVWSGPQERALADGAAVTVSSRPGAGGWTRVRRVLGLAAGPSRASGPRSRRP